MVYKPFILIHSYYYHKTIRSILAVL